MSNELEVRYRVTVYVRVDLDSRRVTGVEIDDNQVALDYPADETDPAAVVSDPILGGIGVSSAMIRRAVKIAETKDWPAWRYS